VLVSLENEGTYLGTVGAVGAVGAGGTGVVGHEEGKLVVAAPAAPVSGA